MKMLNKNIAREFKLSIARFISVSALLMLGVFVLIGLNVTGPNMRRTAQKTYNTEKLADAKVTSTVALNAKDRETVRQLSGIKTAEFAHTTDVVIKDSRHAVRIQSNPNKLSKLTITKGRKAQAANEVVLDDKLAGRYQIGQKVTFVSGKSGSKTGLKLWTYKIVGFAMSTEFLKKDNLGSTSLGSGTLSGFGYVTKSAFSNSEPNVARLAFSNPKGQAYSTSYEHHAKTLTDKLQKKLNARNETRVAELRTALNDKISSGESQLRTNEAAIKTAATQLTESQQLLTTQLAAAKSNNNLAAIAQIEAKQQLLKKQLNTLNSKRASLATAKSNLAKAKTTSNQLDDITFTVESRNDYNDGYNNYGEDAQRIDVLGRSFPAFFFLIAIMVSFTTMQRMVDEKRIEMGTMRALGYTNGEVMREFLVYSITTAVTGTVLGSALGLVVLPRIIFRAYTANFNFTTLLLAPHVGYVMVGLILALASTVLASWLAARSSLKIIPAELMLPKPPTNGSRILLERIKPLWRKMSFSYKVTARNLFRYKGRMFMTIIGVAGATALMITGFGIRDSLNTIVGRQFGDISQYDLVTVYNPNAGYNAVRDAQKAVKNSNQVKRDTAAYFANVYATTSSSDTRENIALMVPKSSNQLDQYIKLRDYKSGKNLSLTDSGAVISQKLAKLQGVSVGDTINLKDTDGTAHRVRVAAITTMYAGHYVYMNRTYYQKVYGKAAMSNAYLVTLKHNTSKSVNAFASHFNRQEAAVETVQSRETKKTITNILGNLSNLILVLVVSASLLSLVVLYTLTNINVSERMRELSTLKVLGFYPREVLMYIYRETNILTVAGILVGIGVGYLFHAYIMALLPPATAMVAPGLTWINIVISVGLTVVFSLMIMFTMNRKIQSVDMLEALKSVD